MLRERVLSILFTVVLTLLSVLGMANQVNALSPSTNENIKLPQEVSSEINSAVDVEYYTNDGSKIEKASGVKISSNITMSAGHEFLQNGPIGKTTSTNACRQLSIYSHNDRNNDVSTGNKVVATYAVDNAETPDISLIKTNGNSQFNILPVVRIGQVPDLGEKLYFVNYEPASNLLDRNPNIQQNAETISSIYAKPAIYDGVVLDNTNNMYLVATGLNSYGSGIADNASRPGASGGPVFNSKGQVIGIIVSIINNTVSARQLSSMYNVKFDNTSPDTQLQIEEIQPITPTAISFYKKLLANSSNSLPNSTSICGVFPTVNIASFSNNLLDVHKQNIFLKALATINSKTIAILFSGIKIINI
jgi:V8-like Glu-specific endopeptidase